jgi:hypothetical protein
VLNAFDRLVIATLVGGILFTLFKLVRALGGH